MLNSLERPLIIAHRGDSSSAPENTLAALRAAVTGEELRQQLEARGAEAARRESEGRQAEAEGLDKVFIDAGMEWRLPGCSMCLAMNADKLAPGERSASTSNRNFEGRQGPGGRTHLVSPAMAAAAAIAGHLTDIRDLD